MIYLASDHAGYELKELVKSYLTERGEAFEDLGPNSEDRCDYPDYGHALAEKMIETGEMGMAVCGSGLGISMTLNRHAGIRAARCRDADDARMSRLHNDANCLVFAGRQTDEATAREMVDAFLETPFEGGRHEDRIRKIDLS